MILKTGDVHQVDYRWSPGRDLTTFAHSGLDDRDLGTLETWVLPLARAPQGPDTPRTSIVHKAFPEGLGSHGGPLGVVILRRYCPAAAPDVGPAGTPSRRALMSRALVIPDIDTAGRVAIGLALVGHPDLRPDPTTRQGPTLHPIPYSAVEYLIREESTRNPGHIQDQQTWNLLLATVKRFLSVGSDPEHRQWIDATPQWAPDLPPPDGSHGQLVLLKTLFAALRGGFSGLDEAHKPWDGSFSTFEQVAEGQDTQLLPRLVFERPAMSTGRGRYGRLSLQNAHTALTGDAALQLADLLVRQAVRHPPTMWEPDALWRQDSTYTRLLADHQRSTTEADDPIRTQPAQGPDRPEAAVARQEAAVAAPAPAVPAAGGREPVALADGPVVSAPSSEGYVRQIDDAVRALEDVVERLQGAASRPPDLRGLPPQASAPGTARPEQAATTTEPALASAEAPGFVAFLQKNVLWLVAVVGVQVVVEAYGLIRGWWR